jgi:hypothetical protein
LAMPVTPFIRPLIYWSTPQLDDRSKCLQKLDDVEHTLCLRFLSPLRDTMARVLVGYHDKVGLHPESAGCTREVSAQPRPWSPDLE